MALHYDHPSNALEALEAVRDRLEGTPAGHIIDDIIEIIGNGNPPGFDNPPGIGNQRGLGHNQDHNFSVAQSGAENGNTSNSHSQHNNSGQNFGTTQANVENDHGHGHSVPDSLDDAFSTIEQTFILGNDSLASSNGDDTVHGSEGLDTVHSSDGFDTVQAGEGQDTVQGSEDFDVAAIQHLLDQGASLTDIIENFVASAEFRNDEPNDTFAELLDILEQSSDGTGENPADQSANGAAHAPAEVAIGIVGSPDAADQANNVHIVPGHQV